MDYYNKQLIKNGGILLGSGGVSGILGYLKDKRNKKENFKDLKTETLNFLKAFGKGVSYTTLTTYLAYALTHGINNAYNWYRNYKLTKFEKNKPEYIKTQKDYILNVLSKYTTEYDIKDIEDFEQSFNNITPYFDEEKWNYYNQLSLEGKINMIIGEERILKQKQQEIQQLQQQDTQTNQYLKRMFDDGIYIKTKSKLKPKKKKSKTKSRRR
jgi:hypothetical protein